MKRLLLVKTGAPSIAWRRGNFEHWFGPHFAEFDVQLQVWDAQVDPPPAGRWDAMVVTGSPCSVHDRLDWSERAGRFLVDHMDSTAILGVCYGHQLLAHALGARTGPNPQGAEYGVHPVQITPDPLFTGMGPVIDTYQMHSNAVLELPQGARRLGRSARTSIQAFAIGDRIRAVQFHPEFDRDYVQTALETRGAALDAVEPGVTARSLATVRELPDPGAVIRNFLEFIAEIPRR